MTSDRADDLKGSIKEVDGALGDNDDLNGEDKSDRATSTARAAVDRAHWHYYHVSTP